jgi:hypothetical protein
MDFNTLTLVISGIIGFIISLSALFFGLGYYKQGKTQSKLDTNTLLKEQIDALEMKVKTQILNMGILEKRVKDLTDAIEVKDKKLAEVLEILQGRDPQTQEVLAKMLKYTESGGLIFKALEDEIFPVIRKLSEFLEIQKKFH